MKTVAKALIFDENNNVLILRRSLTHPNFPHHPDLPGGEVELNERHAEAVRREIQEEAGLDAPLDFLRLVHQEEISDNLMHLVYTIQIPEKKPQVALSWEHDDFEWMDLGKLKSLPLPNGVDEFYEMAMNHLWQYVANREIYSQ